MKDNHLTSLNLRLKLLLISFTLFSMFSCNPAKKALKNGDYDSAIETILKHPQKLAVKENGEDLKNAFSLANTKDMDKILSLKSSGQPYIWHEIFDLYTVLQQRQQKIETLPDEVLQQMGLKTVDFSADLELARGKAAAYYYALAAKKLETGTPENQQEAIECLLKIQSFFPGYRDVDAILAKIQPPAPLLVYYQIENNFPYNLPPGSLNDLTGLDFSVFDTPDLKFVNQKPSNDQYKVYVEISISHIKILPERTGELSYTESVEMQDGVAYQLDENGNFIIDSLGRKIEIPKFNTLVCFITEYKQEKSMIVQGTLEIIERKTGKILSRKTVLGETKFSHIYAKFNGDMDALSPETFALVGTKKMEYPTDAAMIRVAASKLAEDAAQKTKEVLDNVEL